MKKSVATFLSVIILSAFTAASVFGATVNISAVDFSFSPASKTIAVGDTVKWTNKGQAPHTTTSGSSCSSDGQWDSGTLSPGQSFSRTFTVPGTYHYFCAFHCSIGMVGTIVVAEAGAGTPKISAKPASLNLGNVRIGSASNPGSITVSNSGTADLVISSKNFTGTNAAEFAEQDDCSTVAPGKPCTVNVTLTATSFGKKSAILNIGSNDPKKAVLKVRLSGNAVPPKITVKPASLNFGAVTVGSSADAKTVTVKNSGVSDLVMSSINFGGTNSAEFSENSDCTTVAAGGTCTVNVTMTATSAGKKSATLNIQSNDPKKAQLKVRLSGKATTAPAAAPQKAAVAFSGESPISKEELAAFLVLEAEGDVKDDYCDSGSPFTDVAPDRWSCKYIKRLYELGIATACPDVKGTPVQDGTIFCPEAPATGEMLSDILTWKSKLDAGSPNK